MESVYPFLLVVAPFAIAFLIEAVVIFLFRVKRFWPALGVSLAINILSLAALYLGSLLAGKMGYALDGMVVPLPVLFFFWWLSVMADGLLLQLFTRGQNSERLFLCSVIMNTLAWLFLYLFIVTTR